jgi:WD40 repeat protein
VYRDLSKPMGALFREEEFRVRYDSLVESAFSIDSSGSGSGGSSSNAAAVAPAARGATNVSTATEVDDPLVTKPFHYGTHYSSAAITLHYLMRLEPFTSHFRSLHDGKFDHADRLFASIHGAWRSAAGVEGAQNGGTQDVKELIPEFFYLPAFLKNINSCDFGRDQNGVEVSDVALPPWANGSPAEFVRLNREALESSVVSASLHHWIDLIFGYKQQGPAAVEACNVFYHLTYEGAVDLDAIHDTATKRAIVAQIAEFGQTPSQLFKSPHPARSRSAVAASGMGSGTNGAGSSFLSTSASSLGSSVAPSAMTALSFHGLASKSLSASSAAAAGINAVPMAAPSPLTARSLASSFLEGGELMNRMQTIISGAGSGSNGYSNDEQGLVLDQAPLLQAQLHREVPVNAVVAAHRSQLLAADYFASGPDPIQATPASRRRMLSTGQYASSIHQIAMASGSVEKRIVALGPKCLFLPPRNTEFVAWGFQDSSLKVLSTGSSESGHSGDSKVLVSIDVPFGISVAAISSDGRTLVTGSGDMPVMRIWRLEPHRRPAVPSLSASAAGARRRDPTTATDSPVSTRIAGSGGIGSSGVGGGSGSSSGGGLGISLGSSLGSHSATKSLMVVATASSPEQDGAITAICVSREFSIFVSGCSAGVAVLWDLNHRRVVRSLPSFDSSGASVAAVEINEVTGDIVVAVGERFGVYDVNGALRVRLDYTTLFHDPKLSRAPIVSLALERLAACEWRAEKRVVTGHANGVLCVWAYVSAGAGGGFGSGADEDDDEWTLELQARRVANASGSALTAVFLSADERKLWSGSCDGILSLWTPRTADSTAMAPTMALTSLPPSP